MANNLESRERVFGQDPLADLKNQTRRLNGLLENKGIRLTCSIFGALHTGHINDQIRGLITTSDLVTVELPSIAVNSDFSPSRNLFWFEVLEFARSRGKQIRGVNNNFAAVNDLKVLGARKDHPPFAVSVAGRVSPFDFYVSNTMDIFVPISLKYPDVFDLSLTAISHLIRLRVDKTQLGQILKYAVSVVRSPTKFSNPSEINVVHIGGAAHNPNLLAMAAELLSDSDRITVLEVHDGRVAPFVDDDLTFFARMIPLFDGLLATDIVNDQVLIDERKAQQVLNGAVEAAVETVAGFYTRQKVLESFQKMHPADDTQFEKFLVNFLLSLVPNEDLDNLPALTANFPVDLMAFIQLRYPEKKSEVEIAAKVLQERARFFSVG